MKVILTMDVDNLGLAGQEVDVARGFARNKLFPSKEAVEATVSNLKSFEKMRVEYDERSMKEKERAQKYAGEIEQKILIIHQKAGEKDKLFGSVTTINLAEAMADEGLDIDRKRIKLKEPIKMLGDYDVPIRLHPEVTAMIKVSVVRVEE